MDPNQDEQWLSMPAQGLLVNVVPMQQLLKKLNGNPVTITSIPLKAPLLGETRILPLNTCLLLLLLNSCLLLQLLNTLMFAFALNAISP
jgi:hypothetical protein